MSDIEQRLREAMDGVEEGLRLAEVGEYLYNECAYSYGDGRTEPREYGIEWQWQQAKPDEYGQGELLAASTKWHAEQAADGIGTEATKLRDTITSLRSKLEEAEGARGWQPIETAPKDGTPILAYRSPSAYGTRSPLVFVAWHDESQAWIWPDDTYDPYVRDSYDDAFNEGSEFADTSFSHWMPIPSQPALASLREADHA